MHPNDTGYDGGDYSGIFAYAPGAGVNVGDRVNIASTTPADFFGQIQLNGPLSALDGGVIIASSGNPLPPPEVVRAARIRFGVGVGFYGVAFALSWVSPALALAVHGTMAAYYLTEQSSRLRT